MLSAQPQQVRVEEVIRNLLSPHSQLIIPVVYLLMVSPFILMVWVHLAVILAH